MSNDEIEYDDDGNEIEPAKPEGKNLKQLREKADRVDAADAKVATLERKLAFADIGLPKTKSAEDFQKAYEGDMTPEAITEAAIERGLVEKPADPNAVTDAEVQAGNAVQDAGAGGDSVTPPGFYEELEAAQNPVEAHAVMVKYGQAVADLH